MPGELWRRAKVLLRRLALTTILTLLAYTTGVLPLAKLGYDTQLGDWQLACLIFVG